ncbi:hypothetical protein [Nonomuraea insulae]|uniref:Uncharacterized protein n=1 Tax=Nonomuraea insulae TaxID=1616787 RepID=A0ABW1CQJ9_9ACTN
MKLSPSQAALGDRPIGAWTRFAATGDPNGGREQAWPRLRDDRGQTAWYVQCPDLRPLEARRPRQGPRLPLLEHWPRAEPHSAAPGSTRRGPRCGTAP